MDKYSIIGMGIILCLIAFLFAIWGGYPVEGVSWKYNRLDKEIDYLTERSQTTYDMAVDNKNKQIEDEQRYKTLNNLVKDYEDWSEDRFDSQAGQIEVLRTQVNQREPK